MGVHVSDDIFSDMSAVQMLWYSYNIREDEKEKIEIARDIAEYMMSFVNPEAVNKIKASRDEENQKLSTDSPENIIDDIVKGSSNIFEDIEEIKSLAGYSETNNNRELKEGIDFKGSLFDLTKEY